MKQRRRAENEFLKMPHNSIVIQLNAVMAQLHKKCDFANFTLIFSFKLNSDDKTNKSHTGISFIFFRNVSFQSARCLNLKMNESRNPTPLLEDAALIQLERINRMQMIFECFRKQRNSFRKSKITHP